MAILEGKKFLLTHTQISNIMGSTVVAAELAEYLKTHGADVTVFAASFSGPAAELFRKNDIKVVIDENWDIDPFEYDYIWVHSQVLPLNLLRKIGCGENRDKQPIFIFHHMSAISYAPDERPYIRGLEAELSSLSIFVSIETKDKLESYYIDALETRAADIPRSVFPNTATQSFIDIENNCSDELKEIAIVSNHK